MISMLQQPLWASSLVLLLVGNQLLNCQSQEVESPVCPAENDCKAPSDQDAATPIEKKATHVCRLWMAESIKDKGAMGVFSGVDVAMGETIAEGETLIPLFDINDKERSQWKEVSWDGEIQADLLLQNDFNLHSFIPGLAALVSTSTSKFENVRIKNNLDDIQMDTAGVHRSTHPSAGSFGDRYPLEYQAEDNIAAGQEFFTREDVTPSNAKRKKTSDKKKKKKRKKVASLEKLQRDGVCLDGITTQTSTIEGAGRGAFTNRAVSKGEIITTSPTVLFHRAQMEIVEQYMNEKNILKFTEHLKSRQLLLNYAYGHENSTVLMLPYGPGVNFINHNGNQPNAVLKWSDALLSNHKLLELDAAFAVTQYDKSLLIDVVALRDLEPSEEIFIDYGESWEKAWQDHVQAWKAPSDDSANYISASDYKRQHADGGYLRTLREQESDPYPDNIRTACFFKEYASALKEQEEGGSEYYDAESEEVYWTNLCDGKCLRPCDIVARYEVEGETYYTVTVHDMRSKFFPSHCELALDRGTVLRTPERVITLVDMEYTSDQFLENAFRHEIGLPSGMIPKGWLSEEPKPMGDFLRPDLKPGQIEQIKWENGDVVTEHAYTMGLSPSIRNTLLEYCDKMGITDKFRDMTYRGNSLKPRQEGYQHFHTTKWYVQRPAKHWRSNMHWISPSDSVSQDDYWQALSAAGFDDVLKQIGEHFGLASLTAYHVTFLAVSHCQRGYVHYDSKNTTAKVFNVIIPLVLANETGPELDVRDDKDYDEELPYARYYSEEMPVGRMRYQYDVAALLGDDAYHATAAVDYRIQKEMRMAATVYVADISEENVDAILDDYTQHYPPRGRRDVLLEMKGLHWQRDDPSVRLPKPVEGHILLEEPDATSTA